MSNITLCDDFIDLYNELIILLKQDWEKTKLFFKKNKKYMSWIIILLITMQFTDIINLGKSWEIYCKKHGVQSGGAGMASDLFGNIENTDTGPKTPKQKRRADRKRGKSAPAPAPAAAAAPAATAPAGPSAKTIKAADKAASGSGTKGLFAKAKSGLSSTVSSSPVFGNLSNIFDALGNVFYVVGIILVIVGVVSLPVLMFLVVLYSVIKNLFGRFSKL